MGKFTPSADQQDLFATRSVIYIPITYTEKKDFIFVRKIKIEKPHGAKALKNEDFKDHDYWPFMYAYASQVTNRLINERYKEWQKEIKKKSAEEQKLLQQKIENEISTYGYSPTFEQSQRISKKHNYSVSYEMPQRLDRYQPRVDYKNYEAINMFIEVSFRGPLDYPRLGNHTISATIGLSCVIPAKHEIVVDMFSQVVMGNSLLQFINDSSFWSLTPGDNDLEMETDSEIGEGYIRVQTRYEMKET